MKKQLLLLMVIVGLQFEASAQFDSTKNYHRATVAYENGDVEEEIVFFSVTSPFQIQNKLAVADEDYYNARVDAGKRIQYRKLDKFKPKDVQYVEIHDGPKFVTKKYSDLSEVGLAAIPKNYLLMEVVEGDIQLYLLFKESMIVTSDEILNDSTSEEMARAKLFKNSDLIIAKGDEIGKNIETIKLDNLIEDNKEIFNAYQNGDYPEAKSAYGSRLKSSSYDKFAGFENLIELVANYNSEG